LGGISEGEEKMTIQGKRPDVEKVLKPLKDFQRKSVERAFQRLYLDRHHTNRFLIADEVGLGKTLVARGIIAKGVDYIWDKVKRIDVIYICSNREIASQNINRLNITDDEQFALTSRLTLLPLKISGLKKRKTNFISFTPSTSFDLRSRAGLMLERAMLYYILRDNWGIKGAGLMNIFQDRANKENWRYLLKIFPRDYKIDSELSERFITFLEKQIEEEKLRGESDIKSRLDDFCQKFSYFRKNVPPPEKYDVAGFIGELRMILAQACLDALEPDIVILDEFQRFKYLLDAENETSQLAQHFFNYVNKDEDTRIILLSATPYKMYTMHQEESVDNHYEDFIRTIRFLFNSEKKTKQFENKLDMFRRELFTVGERRFEDLRRIKEELEKDLKKVMIRTERLGYTADRQGMIEEKKQAFCDVSIEDLDTFAVIDKLAHELGTYDMVELWKSAPYLLNFMDEYELKKIFKKKYEKGELNSNIVNLLRKNSDKLLKWETLKNYKEIIPPNAKLRTLIKNGLDKGSSKLLWVPPSLPYYKSRGVFKGVELKDYTKSLIFSSWQVVPKAISTICSYEAERRMVTKDGKLMPDFDYEEMRRVRKPLLIFTRKEERLQGMANLSLHYPCLTLASKIDPLQIALEIMPENGLPTLGAMKVAVRKKIEVILKDVLEDYREKKGRTDKRWYWAALAMLDRTYHFEEMKKWFESKEKDMRWEDSVVQRKEEDGESFFMQHVKRFKDCFNNPEDLGRPPRRLIDVLTKFALASPAVVGLRSLLRMREGDGEEDLSPVLQGAAQIGAGFRVLFNRPDAISLIRNINDREPYWERVLDYGCNGNLNAVVDEYVHVLRESLGLIDKTFSQMAREIAKAIYAGISLRTISLEYDEVLVPPRSRKVFINPHRVRCCYALRLGEGKVEGDEEVTRSDQVRAAFNSPFRPFILATTSIGQEGLDFHQYCHSIYHWNLPSNPVDLEQREGRIHRYKGLVIRRNIVRQFGLAALKRNKNYRDPWNYLFEKGINIRPKGKDDIIPFWVFEPEDKKGMKIDRHVPCMPLSRDVERLQDLKKTLAVYRMVFGQPRQDDLVEFLKRYMDEEEISQAIQNLRIDLSP